MVKKFLKYLGFIFMGFIGGCLAPMFWSLFTATHPSTLDQAVSIANTYIVFTTIFFVGITVLLALGGYVLSQQLATTRKHLEAAAYEALKKRLQYSETVATEIVKSISENGDFKNQITLHVKNLIQKELDGAAKASSNKAIEAQEKSDKLKIMAINLNNKEES